MRVGILALQGAVDAHERMLRRLGLCAVRVRDATALDGVDGLVLPGGESSTQLHMLELLEMHGALARFRARRAPVLATCAGLILTARRVTQPAQASLGWLDVDVARNGYGRQIDSFHALSDAGQRFAGAPLVFIRAPRITRVGDAVEVLARCAGEPVLVRQGPVTAASFHPELSDSTAIHRAAFCQP